MRNQASEIYKEWADESGYPARDVAGIKQLSDRLASEKNPTGDPNCPVPVRHAGRILRSILAKVKAVSLGGRSDSDNYGECTVSAARDTARVGARENRRRSGAAGIRWNGARMNSDENLLACMSRVA